MIHNVFYYIKPFLVIGISDKILSNENKKPQAKHLQSRAEYLLKILRKTLDLKKGVVSITKMIKDLLRVL